MAYPHGKVLGDDNQLPPIVTELQAVFRELPDEELLDKLKGPRRRGPKGYNPNILWCCYVAYYALGLESVSALIRLLYDNPFVAQACGICSPELISSQPTFSRFGSRLAKSRFALAVKNVMRELTRRLYQKFPGFGKTVAIDSTDIKAWSHGRSKRKVSDHDAGWCVKRNTEGNKKYVWGYKVHILADTKYELPIAVDISSGNVSDLNKATPLMSQGRYTYKGFRPDCVLCDAGYSSDHLRQVIKRYYHAEPIIDPNPTHKKAVARQATIPNWKAIYKQRTAIERLNGRLKAFHKLNALRVRGRFKVRVHAMMSAIVTQAQAIATNSRSSVRKIA